MKVGAVAHVALPVDRLDPAIDWFDTHCDYVEYARGVVDRAPIARLGPAALGPDGTRIELVERTGDRRDAPEPIPPTPTLAVGDLERERTALAAAGVDVWPVEDQPGAERYRIDGPGDAVIEIVEREAGPDWHLDAVTLAVQDPDVAIGWYRRSFAYDLVDRHEDTDSWSYLLAPPDVQATTARLRLRPGTPPGTPRPASAGHVAIACHELERYAGQLRQRGATFVRDVGTCGGTRAVLHDPAAHTLELVERPPEP